MRLTYPVLPIGIGIPTRIAVTVAMTLAGWISAFSRAQQNRREARALAGLDRRMLADIGITHADLRDAFSTPLWEDPTALLRERAIERRLNRHGVVSAVSAQGGRPANGFRRPPINRPARQTV